MQIYVSKILKYYKYNIYMIYFNIIMYYISKTILTMSKQFRVSQGGLNGLKLYEINKLNVLIRK